MSGLRHPSHGVGVGVGVAALAALAASIARATPATPPPSAPTMVDVVERGLRLRVDGWGRVNGVGAPAPPVRFDVEEADGDPSDVDVSGLVIFGWDRPGGLPLAADVMGTVTGDIFGDSPSSAFLDDTSAAPRAQLYSAFVGISGAPGEALAPYTLQVGRMTEVTSSPITYDGAAVGARFADAAWGSVGARVWGGLDAPQRLGADPFSRVDPKAYVERLVEDGRFASPAGTSTVTRSAVDGDGDGTPDPILNAVGGLRLDGKVFGVGFAVHHTLLPTVQRTALAAHSVLEPGAFSLFLGGELLASDLVPRQASVRSDLLTSDGSTRVGARVALQFLEDVCAYDCTFRAFNPAAALVASQVAVIEGFRARDQIRHLNMGPPQEHIAAHLDVERQLPLGFSLSVRGRVRQHFDNADLDYFRTNVLEGGAGVHWANVGVDRTAPGSGGPAIDAGMEVTVGSLDSGRQRAYGFDLLAEGVSAYMEDRVYVRTSFLDGRLSNLAEAFVRRQDIQTRAYAATGQWSAAVANSLRFDIVDFWSVSARVDADFLAPIDALDGSSYLAALVGTTLRL